MHMDVATNDVDTVEASVVTATHDEVVDFAVVTVVHEEVEGRCVH